MVLIACMLALIGIHLLVLYDKDSGVRIGPWVIIRPRGYFKEEFYLEVLDENGAVKEKHPVPKVHRKGVTIGRSKSADIQISADPTVGRKHAILGRDKKGFFLQDNRSANGMFYAKNPKKRVEQISVKFNPNDIYMLSNVKIRFSLSKIASAKAKKTVDEYAELEDN